MGDSANIQHKKSPVWDLKVIFINPAYEQIEVLFTRRMLRLVYGEAALKEPKQKHLMAAILLLHTMRSYRQGELCWRLGEDIVPETVHLLSDTIGEVDWSDTKAWCEFFDESSMFGEPLSSLLRLDSGHCYLRRIWDSMENVATIFVHLIRAMDDTQQVLLQQSCGEKENRPVIGGSPPSADWQAHAVDVALGSRLLLLYGGPGTGKSTTVARIIAATAQFHCQADWFRVMLLAPTGKAAGRLGEAVFQAMERIGSDSTSHTQASIHVATIHRALGLGRKGFAGRKLNADLVVVDESSMLDLDLMESLLRALPQNCRLVLVGDPGQLPPVGAGDLFRELGEMPDLPATDVSTDGAGKSKYWDWLKHRVHLRHSYRFSAGGEVDLLAQAIAGGDYDTIMSLLGGRASAVPDRSGALLSVTTTSTTSETSAGSVLALRHPDEITELCTSQIKRWQVYSALLPDIEAAQKVYLECGVLAAHSDGPGGVGEINRQIISRLQRHHKEHRLISHAMGTGDFQGVMLGQPVLICRNDYRLHLFNGDIGFVYPNKDGEVGVLFPAVRDLSYGNEAVSLNQTLQQAVSNARSDNTNTTDNPNTNTKINGRWIPYNQLPPHDAAFGLTIHKAQGSEFDQVAIVLPPADSAVLTRKLLYTAVTRARKRVTLYADAAVVRQTLAKKEKRSNGFFAVMQKVYNNTSV